MNRPGEGGSIDGGREFSGRRFWLRSELSAKPAFRSAKTAISEFGSYFEGPGTWERCPPGNRAKLVGKQGSFHQSEALHNVDTQTIRRTDILVGRNVEIRF